jgi:hypothetical protein
VLVTAPPPPARLVRGCVQCVPLGVLSCSGINPAPRTSQKSNQQPHLPSPDPAARQPHPQPPSHKQPRCHRYAVAFLSKCHAAAAENANANATEIKIANATEKETGIAAGRGAAAAAGPTSAAPQNRKPLTIPAVHATATVKERGAVIRKKKAGTGATNASLVTTAKRSLVTTAKSGAAVRRPRSRPPRPPTPPPQVVACVCVFACKYVVADLKLFSA